MRIAIVCDWLVSYAGSERVVEQILAVVGEADIFALVDFLSVEDRAFLGGRSVNTSFVQKLPFARKRFRNYLPLFPMAIEQFDLSSYDLIISSSHAVAKGVLTSPDQIHICMCHSPMRYAWDQEAEYLKEARRERGLGAQLVRFFLHRIRIWDYVSAARVDYFLANSQFIRRRIAKIYRRQAQVIYPPVDVEKFDLRRDKEDFYLTASRLVPYKRVALIVSAFRRMPNRKLVVIGDGPEMARIRETAGNAANIALLGYRSTDTLRDYMQRAKAFVFAAREDFGIMPVEAQACGTPVIAYGAGGSLETVRPLGARDPTGLFFDSQTPESICAAVDLFEARTDEISTENCRTHAERFSTANFRHAFREFLDRKIADRHDWKTGRSPSN